MKIIRTDSSNMDFIHLVNQLDAMLAMINGEDHLFYNQFNSIDRIKNVILLYENEKAISCGAFKKFDDSTCEIKRMFTIDACRGKGYAGVVVDELEKWTKELGYSSMVLETSIKLESAVKLYIRKGYVRTEKYGQYKNANDSLCFQKNI